MEATTDIANVGNTELTSAEERHRRAIILDAKLEDALLESFACMAEIVDLKLYQELGYATAKEYFEKKSLTVAQVYRFATIGREIAPQLQDSKFKKEVAQLGVGKLEILARKAEGSLPALMQGNTITLGDEEYSLDDLNDVSVRNLDERLKKLSKKVEENELLNEQKKTLELEKKHQQKRIKELEEQNDKYRQQSESYDEIERDVKEASKLFERDRILVNRIETEQVPKDLALILKTLIYTVQEGGEAMAERHAELLMSMDMEEL